MTGFDDISTRLDSLARHGMYRRRKIIGGPQGRQLTVDGRSLLNFCSNDYLGLAADVRIREAFKAGVDDWGVGAGASHLVCGHTAAHHELEDALAAFTGRERALLFSSGYAANLGVIGALAGKGDKVFEDRLNHASLIDGGRISHADFNWFAHRDMADLDRQLSASGDSGGRKLVVSDGTFSMDGDRCLLNEMISVARRHAAWVMIDDAHGLGVHGCEGRGLVESDKYSTADVPLLMGTFGKAFGTFGAFVAADEPVIEMLIQRARNYIYTTALPSAIAVATLKSLAIVRDEEWRRETLRDRISQFRSGAAGMGFELLPSDSPVQPIVIGDPRRTLDFSTRLEELGCVVTAIRPPTVPVGTSRLRVTLTAAHCADDVDRLLGALDSVNQALGD